MCVAAGLRLDCNLGALIGDAAQWQGASVNTVPYFGVLLF